MLVRWVGTGGLAGHAVNPSVEARMRHPWRMTVPPTHPYRPSTDGFRRVEIKSTPPRFGLG